MTTLPATLAETAQLALRDTQPRTGPDAKRDIGRRPLLRRYTVAWLRPDGGIGEARSVAPALPVFEDAFCAFAHGTLIETPEGPVAVEDLLPGDHVLTMDGSAQPVLWRGTTTVTAGRPDPRGRAIRLTRILSDVFGPQRPPSCVVTGPSARLLRPGPEGAQVMTPVTDLADGEGLIEIVPPGPIDLFHFCLPRHAAIRVGGLAFESYHPLEHVERHPGSSLAPRITSEVLTLATLSAAVSSSVRKLWKVDRSGATHFRMKSTSPFSMWHSRTSGQARQRASNGGQIGLGLALQPDHGEDLHLEAQFARIDLGVVAADEARFLQRADPAQAGRRRDAHAAWPARHWSSARRPATRRESCGRFRRACCPACGLPSRISRFIAHGRTCAILFRIYARSLGATGRNLCAPVPHALAFRMAAGPLYLYRRERLSPQSPKEHPWPRPATPRS
jgi:hypothetical protein